MNVKRIGVLLTPAMLGLSLIVSSNVAADWTGGIEGGQILQGDDSGTRLRFHLSNSDRPFSQAFYADWLRGEDDTNSYEVGYTPRYWFSDKTYVFGEGSARTSTAFQIDLQTRLLAGVGYQLINTETQLLYGEVGAGQVSTDYDDTLIGEEFTDDTTIATARLGASQVISDLLRLELDADFSTADDLETTTAEAGISLRIPGGAVKYSYRVRSQTVGDGDSEEISDSSISFNYGF